VHDTPDASVPTAPVPDGVPAQLVDLAVAMSAVADRATEDGGRLPLEGLVHAAADQVPGARWASITVLRGGRFTTEASSHEQAMRADALQYELGTGPCVDAVLDDNVYLTGDIRSDARWAEYGRRAQEAVGLNSVLAHRLTLHDDSGAIACLNIYSDARDAFDEPALAVGLVLATHASLVVTALLARDRADNLTKALETNREIGVAMGILMQSHRLTREQAFGVLRLASQDSNRKLSDIARDVAETGVAPVRRRLA
jgi:ANTAR domain